MEEENEGDYGRVIDRTGIAENWAEIFGMVLVPKSRSAKRFKPIIEIREVIDPITKEKQELPVITGYEESESPFREKHTADETTSFLSRYDKNLVRIDRQLCTLFQLITEEEHIDLRMAYDYFFENSTDELNLSKSVEQKGLSGLRTTRTYQEGKLDSKQTELTEKENKGIWGLLRK